MVGAEQATRGGEAGRGAGTPSLLPASAAAGCQEATCSNMLEAKNALVKKFPQDFVSAELSDEELEAAAGAGCGWTHESEGHCGKTHETEGCSRGDVCPSVDVCSAAG